MRRKVSLTTWMLGYVAHPRGWSRCRGCGQRAADTHAARILRANGETRLAGRSELCEACRKQALQADIAKS